LYGLFRETTFSWPFFEGFWAIHLFGIEVHGDWSLRERVVHSVRLHLVLSFSDLTDFINKIDTTAEFQSQPRLRQPDSRGLPITLMLFDDAIYHQTVFYAIRFSRN
jgi:hypothetical protein